MSENPTAKTANLTSFFTEKDAQDSFVGKRICQMVSSSVRTEKPPFPRQIQIETTNACNHKCNFCAYTTMTRPKRHMDRSLFERLVKEAYELGAREIGLFAGAEPLMCKWLDEYIAYCRNVGYEYLYISTNGALGSPEKFKKIMDAGLSSIKFSVNAGTPEMYARVHGRDDFDKVINNIRFVSKYRKQLSRPFYLGVSFVGTALSHQTFPNLKALLEDTVDEIIYYEASNQSGQMEDLPLPPYSDCDLPFNKLHISLEGYIKACCNDYENMLAIEDLNHFSLIEAWHSDRFQALRRAHIDDQLEGTLCGKCLRACHQKALPIHPGLSHVETHEEESIIHFV